MDAVHLRQPFLQPALLIAMFPISLGKAKNLGHDLPEFLCVALDSTSVGCRLSNGIEEFADGALLFILGSRCGGFWFFKSDSRIRTDDLIITNDHLAKVGSNPTATKVKSRCPWRVPPPLPPLRTTSH
jgi:hypothetical protein